MDSQLVYVSNYDRSHLNSHPNGYPNVQPGGYPNSYPSNHPNSHKAQLNLPEYLFYVEHTGSQTVVPIPCDDTLDTRPPRDMVAPDTSQRYLFTKAELKQRMAEHLQMRHNPDRPSCFLSTFSNITHAFNWAMQQKGPVWVHKIDTKLLPRDMYKHWVCWVPGQDEYLFLHRIPCIAMVSEHHIKDDDDEPRKCFVTPPLSINLFCKYLGKSCRLPKLTSV
ncbi:hypothetical protein QBC32DRAFT_222148 [Pseudoneurospora amorphoporcata]|uniref:DUF7587 domain-containing protein n=1 Tax=Pseudoneurospora amorphoporcata TaxID=241081 RepID=A0AAN6NNQ1_9PEZI|nr:hypothetical protein QBC32DRAFT_222148 [Pseudoneurospora amorphoporcata]